MAAVQEPLATSPVSSPSTSISSSIANPTPSSNSTSPIDTLSSTITSTTTNATSTPAAAHTGGMVFSPMIIGIIAAVAVVLIVAITGFTVWYVRRRRERSVSKVYHYYKPSPPKAKPTVSDLEKQDASSGQEDGAEIELANSIHGTMASGKTRLKKPKSNHGSSSRTLVKDIVFSNSNNDNNNTVNEPSRSLSTRPSASDDVVVDIEDSDDNNNNNKTDKNTSSNNSVIIMHINEATTTTSTAVAQDEQPATSSQRNSTATDQRSIHSRQPSTDLAMPPQRKNTTQELILEAASYPGTEFFYSDLSGAIQTIDGLDDIEASSDSTSPRPFNPHHSIAILGICNDPLEDDIVLSSSSSRSRINNLNLVTDKEGSSVRLSRKSSESTLGGGAAAGASGERSARVSEDSFTLSFAEFDNTLSASLSATLSSQQPAPPSTPPPPPSSSPMPVPVPRQRPSKLPRPTSSRYSMALPTAVQANRSSYYEPSLRPDYVNLPPPPLPGNGSSSKQRRLSQRLSLTGPASKSTPFLSSEEATSFQEGEEPQSEYGTAEDVEGRQSLSSSRPSSISSVSSMSSSSENGQRRRRRSHGRSKSLAGHESIQFANGYGPVPSLSSTHSPVPMSSLDSLKDDFYSPYHQYPQVPRKPALKFCAQPRGTGAGSPALSATGTSTPPAGMDSSSQLSESGFFNSLPISVPHEYLRRNSSGNVAKKSSKKSSGHHPLVHDQRRRRSTSTCSSLSSFNSNSSLAESFISSASNASSYTSAAAAAAASELLQSSPGLDLQDYAMTGTDIEVQVQEIISDAIVLSAAKAATIKAAQESNWFSSSPPHSPF